ncbi:MAG TPA: tyrosine-type recombinase/integrase [Candidatus Bathyarchaeia archaeon]
MSDYLGTPMSDARGYLLPEEVRLCIDHTGSLRDRAILWLLWATGCRLTELLMFTVKDISWRDKALYMWTLKRKEKRRYQRIVLVDDATISLIREYLEAYDVEGGHLFGLTARRVEQIVATAGKAAGIPRVGEKMIHPHHFRHSHCVAWVRANPTMEGLRKLQQRVGHASITTTAHYLQFAFEEQREDMERVLGGVQ